jgi:hypothetical protein
MYHIVFTYSGSLNIRLLNQCFDFSSSSIFNKMTLSYFAKITRKLFNLSYYLSLIKDDTNIEWSEIVTLNVSHFYYSGSLNIRPLNHCCDFGSIGIFTNKNGAFSFWKRLGICLIFDLISLWFMMVHKFSAWKEQLQMPFKQWQRLLYKSIIYFKWHYYQKSGYSFCQ